MLASDIPAAGRAVARSDNNPPGPLIHGQNAMVELSAFLRENPVIQTQDQAKQGSAYIERTRVSLNEMETERKEKVAPLNEHLGIINAAYRNVREPLESALKVLRARLTSYASAIEAARIAEAEKLRKEAEAKEAAARAAERAEQDAIACADVGELSDVGAAIEQADHAFSDFKRADRQAAIAERSVPVRFNSVMGGRTQAMRTVEVLVIDDIAQAIKVMGITEKIAMAVLSSARDFRKEFDELPAGVRATFERSL